MHFDGKVELTSSLRKQLQHNKTNTKVDITLLLTYCMNRTKRDKRRSDLELLSSMWRFIIILHSLHTV